MVHCCVATEGRGRSSGNGIRDSWAPKKLYTTLAAGHIVRLAKQGLNYPLFAPFFCLGFPLLSIVLAAAPGPELFMNLGLSTVIISGLWTVFGIWQWWHSRGKAPEQSEMPTGMFVSLSGLLVRSAPDVGHGRAGALCHRAPNGRSLFSLLVVVSAVFSNSYFLGQYNSRQKILDEKGVSGPRS